MTQWIMVMGSIMDIDYGLWIWIGHGYQTLYGYEMTLLRQG